MPTRRRLVSLLVVNINISNNNIICIYVLCWRFLHTHTHTLTANYIHIALKSHRSCRYVAETVRRRRSVVHHIIIHCSRPSVCTPVYRRRFRHHVRGVAAKSKPFYIILYFILVNNIMTCVYLAVIVLGNQINDLCSGRTTGILVQYKVAHNIRRVKGEYRNR